MLWISFFLICFSIEASELPRFLTKHSPETLRYISMDGRYAYVEKSAGVLGLITSFRSIDFLSEPGHSEFLVKASRFKKRIAVEVIPNAHDEFNLFKNNKIFVVDYGSSSPKEVGKGKGARLHLNDEWISYYDGYQRLLHIQNIITQKKYDIRLSKKANPFFVPQVEMISDNVVVYTDINEAGYSALVSFNLITKTSTINYKGPQTGTRLEICQREKYLAVGEFPYDGVSRGSKIQQIKLSGGAVNLTGLTTIYSSVEQDIGNMVCLPDSIYFVKTMNQDKELNFKVTEAVKLNLKDQSIDIKSDLKHVTQILEMDGRILIPLRGEFYVLEGRNNLSEDILKSIPNKEELPLEI